MAVDHPILGVGPGRYLETMRTEYQLDDNYPFIVHNVSLAMAAENGIPIGVVFTVLFGWTVVRLVRKDPLSAAFAVSLLGFVVFDVLHYDRPVGLIMTGIWLGVASNLLNAQTSRRVRSS